MSRSNSRGGRAKSRRFLVGGNGDVASSRNARSVEPPRMGSRVLAVSGMTEPRSERVQQHLLRTPFRVVPLPHVPLASKRVQCRSAGARCRCATRLPACGSPRWRSAEPAEKARDEPQDPMTGRHDGRGHQQSVRCLPGERNSCKPQRKIMLLPTAALQARSAVSPQTSPNASIHQPPGAVG